MKLTEKEKKAKNKACKEIWNKENNEKMKKSTYKSKCFKYINDYVNSSDELESIYNAILSRSNDLGLLLPNQIRSESEKKKNKSISSTKGSMCDETSLTVITNKKNKSTEEHFILIEKFLKDKALSVEQVISKKESVEFNIIIAEDGLTDKERITFKKELSRILEHQDHNSSWRVFKTYVKRKYLNI